MVRDSEADPEFHVCVCGGGAQFFKQKIVSSESIGCEAMLEGSAGGMLPRNFFWKMEQFGAFWCILAPILAFITLSMFYIIYFVIVI